MRQVYQTTDGTIFENSDEAGEHEDACYESWLGAYPKLLVHEFLDSLDKKDLNSSYYVGASLIREFWEKQYES